MGGSIVFQWQPFLRCRNFGREIVAKNGKNRRQKAFSEGSCRLVINNHKICNVTYNTSDKIPLHHFSGLEASFDQYMEQKERIIRSIIPEKATAKQLNQDDWRIKMPVAEALFLRVEPIIDVRVITKTNGENYPPHIPPHITKLFEVHAIKWEIEGVPADYLPPLFELEASGILYPQTQGTHSLIVNQINTNINAVFPSLLSWVPQHILQNILFSIIRNIVDDIKKGCHVRLLADYRSFQRRHAKFSSG